MFPHLSSPELLGLLFTWTFGSPCAFFHVRILLKGSMLGFQNCFHCLRLILLFLMILFWHVYCWWLMFVCVWACFFVYLQPTRTSMSITFTHIAVALWEPSHSQPTLIWAEVRVSMWMCPICGMNLPWIMHLCTDLSFQPSAGFGICLAASRHSFTLPCILGQNMQKLRSSSNKC